MKVELSDEEIIEKYKISKDINLFRCLIKKYQTKVYRTAMGMLGSKEESEEVVQDVFVKIHQGTGAFRQNSSVASWIFRVTHNVCLDVLRIRRRRNAIKIISLFDKPTGDGGDSEGTDYSQNLADERAEPEQKLAAREQSEVVAQCLLQLPEAQRAVLVLHDIEGFSYQQISEIVGEKIGTVRSRLHYGRLKLKELIEPYFACVDEEVSTHAK